MGLLKTAIGRLRVIGFFEGLSFIILVFIAVPLKYIFKMPTAVKIVGMAHGLLFVLYILGLIQVAIALNWNFRKIALAFVASILPFGTFYADKKLFKPEQEAQENS